jgi:hypothetical protein
VVNEAMTDGALRRRQEGQARRHAEKAYTDLPWVLTLQNGARRRVAVAFLSRRIPLFMQ